jgi:hypothetical protein
MLRPVAPVFEYIINEDYIAEFLCVNKDKPELKCNGKCYLMQMLKEQQDNKEQNLPGIAMDKYPIGFVKFAVINNKNTSFIESSLSFTYLNSYSFLFSISLFHPPTEVMFFSV